MIRTFAISSGRGAAELGMVAEARRMVGLERQYTCEACGAEHRSWTRLHACSSCAAPLTVAVIRRAAVAA